MLAAQRVLKNWVVFAILVIAFGGAKDKGSFGVLCWSVIMETQGRKRKPRLRTVGVFSVPRTRFELARE